MSERNTSSLDSALPSSNLDEQIELGSHSGGGSVLLDSPQEEVSSVPVVDEAVESDGSWHSVDEDDDDDDDENDDDDDEGDNDHYHDDDNHGSAVEGGFVPRAASVVGCSHYQRNCRMVAPCCGKEYWCRHCHNEAEETVAALTCVPPTSHTLDRYAVTEVVCAQCSTRQPVSNTCTTCGIQFGKYFCSTCNFWDHRAEEKKYYHCHGCGMCRVGGLENFVHCDVCGHCISRASMDDGTHQHKPGSMKQDCPCCLEDLFTSTRSSTTLPCGHNVHVHCFSQFARSQPWTRCPLCRKTALSPRMCFIMAAHIDSEIARCAPSSLFHFPVDACNVCRTPMSSDILAMFPNGVAARCYDCQAVHQVPWHPFGMKCRSCGSYNTISEN